MIDDANGLLAVKPLLRGRTSFVTLYAGEPPKNSDGAFFFLSEEDAVLKGSYLWALAHFTAPDQLLVWLTDKKRNAFVELVQTGELPGRIVEPREGRSGIWDRKVEQTVILGDLTEEHLKLILERRGELFDLVPWVIERLPPIYGPTLNERQDSSDALGVE